MSDNLKLIAQRIKELREINGLSIESLSKEFNIPIETFKKYESGDVDIPIGFLYQMANRFDVELTAIISGEEPRLRLYSVVRKDKGLSIERRKEYKYQDLSYNFINKKAETFLVTADPGEGEKKSNYYSHEGQEFNYVIGGTLKVIIDGHEVVLEEGDAIYFDSGHKHGMKAMNNKAAKFIAVIIK